MAADPLAVLTTVEARIAVGAEAADTRQDARLEPMVAAVSRKLDERFGAMVQRTVTGELHDGGVGPDVFPRVWPVQAVTAITEAGTVLTAADYVVSADGRRITRRLGRHAWSWGGFLLELELTYTAGRYATTGDVDELVKEAARLTLRNLWRSEQVSAGQLDEYDVPAANFPRVAVPAAAAGLLSHMDGATLPGIA